MNFLTMPDSKLATLRNQVADELARRSKAAIKGHDAAAIIYGNEAAKRALVVAAAGRHSILFIGPPNCGKTMMRAVALEIGLTDTFEARPCPCGWRSHRDHPCRCSAKQAERHIAKLPLADITVEMHQPENRDRIMPGSSLPEMQQYIANAIDHETLDLDETASRLLRASVQEMGLDEAVRQRVVQVARTIANLDQAERIHSAHVCEAVNYRLLRR